MTELGCSVRKITFLLSAITSAETPARNVGRSEHLSRNSTDFTQTELIKMTIYAIDGKPI